jgi:hypothetical protein
MAKKAKFDMVKHVKAMSRAQIGPLPKTKVVPQKRRCDMIDEIRQKEAADAVKHG